MTSRISDLDPYSLPFHSVSEQCSEAHAFETLGTSHNFSLHFLPPVVPRYNQSVDRTHTLKLGDARYAEPRRTYCGIIVVVQADDLANLITATD